MRDRAGPLSNNYSILGGRGKRYGTHHRIYPLGFNEAEKDTPIALTGHCDRLCFRQTLAVHGGWAMRLLILILVLIPLLLLRRTPRSASRSSSAMRPTRMQPRCKIQGMMQRMFRRRRSALASSSGLLLIPFSSFPSGGARVTLALVPSRALVPTSACA
jgi:hypothetical protein